MSFVAENMSKLYALSSNSDQVYEYCLRTLAQHFNCTSAGICVLHRKKNYYHSQFFAVWRSSTKSIEKNNELTTVDEITVTEFEHMKKMLKEKITKYEVHYNKSTRQLCFYSGLYFFSIFFNKKTSEMEQLLLVQFLEMLSIALPIFFQLRSLSESTLNFQEENELLKSIIAQNEVTMRSQLQYSYSNIMGKSEQLLKVLHYLDKVIQFSDARDIIYLHGESGTGKSLLAQSIHKYSNRSEERFVEVNCGALVENLFEAEFFGIAPNSGIANASKQGKTGVFEMADKGFLFLDEVSELTMPMQAALLTAMEGKKFRRVCGNQDITVDVRIITASIRDIRKLPNFLPELAERLDGVRLEIPPLRERKQDIPKLIDYFCSQLSEPRQKNITAEIRRMMMNYEWPGNIRQLANCIRSCSFGFDAPSYLKPSAQRNKTLKELLDVEKKRIIENRIAEMLAEDHNCTLTAIGETFGLNRDAMRRRLQDIGTDWEKIRRKYTDNGGPTKI